MEQYFVTNLPTFTITNLSMFPWRTQEANTWHLRLIEPSRHGASRWSQLSPWKPDEQVWGKHVPFPFGPRSHLPCKHEQAKKVKQQQTLRNNVNWHYPPPFQSVPRAAKKHIVIMTMLMSMMIRHWCRRSEWWWWWWWWWSWWSATYDNEDIGEVDDGVEEDDDSVAWW